MAKPYSEDLRAAEDTDFAIRLFLDGQRFVMAEAPGAVWKDISDPNRTSSGRKGGRMITWLEDMRPQIPARAYYGCRGWPIAKFVATTNRLAALGMYLTAVLRGCYPRRLAGIAGSTPASRLREAVTAWRALSKIEGLAPPAMSVPRPIWTSASSNLRTGRTAPEK